MRAELKRLHSADAPDLRTFRPADAENFGLLIQVMAGPAGDDASESFDLVVCTPAWLAARLDVEPIIDGRHHLIVRAFDYEMLERFIRDYCAQSDGADWREVATKLSRLGRWEFEDYRPSD